MADEYEVYVESSVRGYHAYFKYASVCIGEVMQCEIEENNDHDKYAVAVRNEYGQMVGHVPIELSKLCSKFLVIMVKWRPSVSAIVIMQARGKDLKFLWTSSLPEIISI